MTAGTMVSAKYTIITNFTGIVKRTIAAINADIVISMKIKLCII